MMQGKWLGLVAILVLFGCSQSEIDGTYSADDGEGTRATIRLDSGQVQFWQNDTNTLPIEGEYRVEGDQILMTIQGRELLLAVTEGCLYPIDDPTQSLCRE
jgi:hypothetical protein